MHRVLKSIVMVALLESVLASSMAWGQRAIVVSPAVTGGLVRGQTCSIVVSCSAFQENTGEDVDTVIADLSAIGGGSSVGMTLIGGHVWQWSGSVVPTVAGVKTFGITGTAGTYTMKAGNVVCVTDSRLAVSGSLIEGQETPITVSFDASEWGGSTDSVTVNLSQIGGNRAQSLTHNGTIWTWQGNITPVTSGSKRLGFLVVHDSSEEATGASAAVVATSAAFVTRSVQCTGAQSCSVVATYERQDEEPSIASVMADLSTLGLSGTQTLQSGSDTYTWSGNVAPESAGPRTVAFTVTYATTPPQTNIVSRVVGVADRHALYANWLFMMADTSLQRLALESDEAYASRRAGIIDAIVDGVAQSHIPVVMLHAPIWHWATTLTEVNSNHLLTEPEIQQLVGGLEARDVKVAFHCAMAGVANGDYEAAQEWQDQAVEKLGILGAKITYADAYRGPNVKFYEEALRGVVGADGILLYGDSDKKFIDGYSSFDQGDPPRTFAFAHPREYAEWRIQQVSALVASQPSYWRREIGWIGEYNFWTTVTLWPLADYQYVWERAQAAGLPVTYQTTMESLARSGDSRLELIGQLQQSPSSLGPATKPWCCVAMSSSGQRMVAAQYGGRLFRSTDAGQSWTECQPAGELDQNWECVAMSGDGSVLAAGAWLGRIYISSNYGQNWDESYPSGAQNNSWEQIVIAQSGTAYTITARPAGHTFYRSTNFGANWTPITPATSDSDDGQESEAWASVTTSSDGTKLVITDGGFKYGGSGSLHTSTDSGTSWTRHVSAGPSVWLSTSCTAMSSDGTRIVLGCWPGQLMVSMDSGATWPVSHMPGDMGDVQRYWQCAAMSADGMAVIAGTWSGRIYRGAYDTQAQAWVWTECQPTVGPQERYWQSVAMSSTGGTILTTDGNYLYRSVDSGSTWSAVLPVRNVTTHRYYSTIQSAINAANTGEEIELAPGMYPERISFGGRNIVLRSTDPDNVDVVDATILDGGDAETVVTFNGTETSAAGLRGLTIRNGYCTTVGKAGGIECSGAAPTIAQCVIMGNRGSYGGGIGNCAGTITDCLIQDNIADSCGGGVSYCNTLRRCQITGNQAAAVGGGLMSFTLLENCLISENSAVYGGGIAYYGSQGVARNCMIYGNDASTGGGGGIFENKGATYYNCTIVDNSSGRYGGGVLVWSTPASAFVNCIIWGNTATDGGAQIAVDGTGTSVSHCDVSRAQNDVKILWWSATLSWGEGNIESDPLLDSSYHLGSGSPCVSAGDSSLNYAGQTDFDGEPRVQGTIDVGADEVPSN